MRVLVSVVTAIVSLAAQWTCVHVFLHPGTSAHIPQTEKFIHGLEAAGRNALHLLQWPSGPWDEETILRSIFFGSIAGAALIELALARVLIRRRSPPRARIWPTLIKFTLLGTESWAIYWLLYTTWFVLAVPSTLALVWAPMLLPAGVVIAATSVQAARATLVVLKKIAQA